MIRGCVDNRYFADDGSQIGVVRARGGGSISEDDTKGFRTWLSRETQGVHRGRIRDGDVGATVGRTVLMMTVYSYLVGVG